MITDFSKSSLEDLAVMRGSIIFFNSRLFSMSKRNVKLQNLYRKFDAIVTDGVPLNFAHKLRTGQQIPCITGGDFIFHLLNEKKDSVLIIGGQPGDANYINNRFAVAWDQLLVPYKDVLTIEDCNLSEENIYSYQWILICVGSPKQDYLNVEIKEKFESSSIYSVGAALDLVCNRRKESPTLLSNLGLRGVYWRFRERPLLFIKKYPVYFWDLFKYAVNL